MWIKISACLIAVLYGEMLFGQTKLSGTVRDVNQKPVVSATLTIRNKEGKITAFTRSNEKGIYELEISPNMQVLTIDITCLGYQRQTANLNAQQNIYNFMLHETAIELPTVVINNRPMLKLNGDTLSYRLADFSGKEDRVLGDVLKKMPGIEVAPNGKISYNGKSISNFYIDGDNLLDDRYNIATKSIPKGAVDQVQVIENDQPIKMLRNKSNSDEVALNITIKPEARIKLMGLAKIAAGVPEKFEEDVNAMMFNKKYKGINYIKSNNIGEDIAADLVSHNLSNFLNRQDYQQPKLLLSTGTNSKPDLPVNRYLFNRAALINVNNLFNITKETQLKTNMHYLQDKQQSDHNQFTEVYLPEGNINYTENQHTVYRPHQVFAQANLNVNKSAVYLSNTLMATYAAMKYNVAMTSNARALDQMLRQKTFNISNELNYMNTLKSGSIYNFYSFLNYRNQPEELNIKPGLNEDIYNGGIP